MSIDPSDGMSIDPLLQQRQEGLKEAEPNAAHRALVELETRHLHDMCRSFDRWDPPVRSTAGWAMSLLGTVLGFYNAG